MKLPIKLWTLSDGYLEYCNVEIQYSTLLTSNDRLYNLLCKCYISSLTYSIEKYAFKKPHNYESLYDFVTDINPAVNLKIKVLDSEDQIVEEIEKAWQSSQFFTNPANFYTMLTYIANIEGLNQSGPFRNTVAAYNKLLNKTEKFKCQADFADKINALVQDKTLESQVTIDLDYKIAILAQKNVGNKQQAAIFKSQLAKFYTNRVENNLILLPIEVNSSPTTYKEYCTHLSSGERIVFGIAKTYNNMYTLSIKTGSCNTCNTRDVNFSSIETAIQNIESIVAVPLNFTGKSNTVTLSYQQLTTILQKLQVCPHFETTTDNRLYHNIKEISQYSFKYSLQNPFKKLEFTLENVSPSLAALIQSSNFTSICGILGLIASLLKTKEAKHDALVPKLIPIYKEIDQLMHRTLTDAGSLYKLNPKQLAILSLDKNDYRGPTVGATAIRLDTNKNHFVKNTDESFIDYIAKHLNSKGLFYTIDPSVYQYISRAIIFSFLCAYFDLRRVSHNFVRWDSETPTLAVDIEDYLRNHIFTNSSEIKSISLMTRA